MFRLGLFYLHNLPALIETAFWADAMLQARLLAIRAEGGLRRPQSVVRAAFAAASFRMSSLWIWHKCSNSVNSK